MQEKSKKYKWHRLEKMNNEASIIEDNKRRMLFHLGKNSTYISQFLGKKFHRSKHTLSTSISWQDILKGFWSQPSLFKAHCPCLVGRRRNGFMPFPTVLVQNESISCLNLLCQSKCLLFINLDFFKLLFKLSSIIIIKLMLTFHVQRQI